eukprot:scaffold578946_cov45-Prasinocladus_malaysianus.AAC.1
MAGYDYDIGELGMKVVMKVELCLLVPHVINNTPPQQMQNEAHGSIVIISNVFVLTGEYTSR